MVSVGLINILLSDPFLLLLLLSLVVAVHVKGHQNTVLPWVADGMYVVQVTECRKTSTVLIEQSRRTDKE
jgi:uncharacterized membrane protein